MGSVQAAHRYPGSGIIYDVPTVTGADWAASDTITGVTVGGLDASHALTVNGSGALSGTITIPIISPGVYDIIITGFHSGAHTYSNAFTVRPATAIFDPASGPTYAVSTVAGTDWVPSEDITSVTVGGTDADYDLAVDGTGALSGTITIPELDPGVFDIVITSSISGSHIFTDAFTVTASFAQTWELDSETHHVGSPILVMKREVDGVLPTLAGAPVVINNGASIIWFSEEAAAPLDGVTFPATDPDNTWNVTLKTSKWTTTCDVVVGIGDPSGSFSPFPEQSISSRSYSSAGGILEVKVTLGSQTVPQGSYLAVKVTNKSGSAKTIDTSGGVSWFTSPDSDPGYPLPEMAAGIMLGSGLIGLAVYTIFKRKKARAGVKTL
jgi:hypothetical protein